MGYLKATNEIPTNASGDEFGASPSKTWNPSQCSFYTPVARTTPITSDSWKWNNND